MTLTTFVCYGCNKPFPRGKYAHTKQWCDGCFRKLEGETMTTHFTHWGYINCTYKAEGDSITFQARKVDCEFCKVSRTFPHGHEHPEQEPIVEGKKYKAGPEEEWRDGPPKKQIHHWNKDGEPYCGFSQFDDVLNEKAFVNCPKCLAKHAKETKPEDDMGPVKVDESDMVQIRKDFEPGYVVRLKSGGPDMTVDRVELKQIRCIWVHDGRKVSYDFHPATLVRIKRPR